MILHFTSIWTRITIYSSCNIFSYACIWTQTKKPAVIAAIPSAPTLTAVPILPSLPTVPNYRYL